MEAAEAKNEEVYELRSKVGSLEKELEQANESASYTLMNNCELSSQNIELEQEIEALRAEVAADREELAQLKKQAKEAAEELHREERSIELEKVRWQQELSNAKSELTDAKATILKQGDKIRELERGYSFKPNPVESALRLEIGNLQAELEAYKQQQPAAEFELPEPAELLNQLKAHRKKSSVTLADVEKILEILEEGSND